MCSLIIAMIFIERDHAYNTVDLLFIRRSRDMPNLILFLCVLYIFVIGAMEILGLVTRKESSLLRRESIYCT